MKEKIFRDQARLVSTLWLKGNEDMSKKTKTLSLTNIEVMTLDRREADFSREMPKHFSFGQFTKLPFLSNPDTKTWGMLFA